ncbi:MAG: cytochrome c nitrite reductase small subunit [Candidatus Hydrogenedentota bacterium]
MRPAYKWAIRLFCLLAGLCTGLGGYTFYYAKGYSYLSNDPKACVNCHIMREEYDGWLKSGHHGVATCNDCHLPAHGLSKWIIKAENGFWHSKSFTLQDFHEPIRVRPHNLRVIRQNCVRCHMGLVNQITPHAGVDEDDEGCIRCHRGVGHGARE